MKTHENQGPICIFLATLDHLIIFILCNLGIQEVERP